MVIVIWSGKGILTPVVAVPAGWLGGLAALFLFEFLPHTWSSWDFAWYVILLFGFWSAAIAHFMFQSWLENNGELDEASFFFIPTEIWTGLLVLAPIVYIIWGVLSAVYGFVMG